MERIEIVAKVENLPQVTDFMDVNLEKVGCPMKVQLQIDIAVEEIYINIASYAYEGKEGMAEILFDYDEKTNMAIMTFIDSGIPYNPLEKEDPDISLPASERQIGGLGIFMVKKSMDAMEYEYKDNKNVLTLKKSLNS